MERDSEPEWRAAEEKKRKTAEPNELVGHERISAESKQIQVVFEAHAVTQHNVMQKCSTALCCFCQVFPTAFNMLNVT